LQNNGFIKDITQYPLVVKRTFLASIGGPKINGREEQPAASRAGASKWLTTDAQQTSNRGPRPFCSTFCGNGKKLKKSILSKRRFSELISF
jgi:hypothetical protein